MTSETQQLVFVSGYATADEPGIQAFGFDSAAGTLTARGSLSGISNPSFMAVHPNGRWLYAVSEEAAGPDDSGGSVWAVRFAREPLAFERVNQQPSGGRGPCHVCLDATGRWLLASNYGSGSIGLLPIQDDGSLGDLATSIQHAGSGPNAARQEGPHAHSALFSPDNCFAIVADLGIDQLVVYAFDAASGTLTAHGHGAARPGAGPRHFTFNADGDRVYVANELDSTVSVYDYDAANGALRELQTLSTLPADAPENSVADIHLSASGTRLYVSNRGHDSLAVYDVAADGQLALLGIVPCGGAWPRNFAVAPDDQFVLVANQHSGDVAVLPVQLEADELGDARAHASAGQPSCVLFVA